MPVEIPVSQVHCADAAPPNSSSRRGWLATMFGSFLGIGMAALGAATGLWTASIARFMMPNVVTEPPSRIKVGSPREYASGYVETRFRQSYGVWLVHGTYRGKSQIYALRTVCTHLGCITLWSAAEKKFKCPCHGSGFHADGMHFEGPASRALERYAIRIADDGQLEIDRSRVFHEELGQWNDPDCYVVV